ncbi:MAG: transglutaminase domain-containing protein, partial [Thermoplasmata archaeon]
MRQLAVCILSLMLIILGVSASLSAAAAEDRGPSTVPHAQRNHRDTDWEIVDTLTTTVQIDAGNNFYIHFDNETLKLDAMQPVDLPAECDSALAMVPAWLKDNLTYKFRQLSPSFRTTYANLIINAPDSKYRDEIAFCVAHTSVKTLTHQYFFPQLLTDNAQLIYQNDQYLSYVDVVEKADYTTISYKNKTNVSFEVPRDIYYWFVVHPKLSDELPTYVNPDYNYRTQAPGSRDYGVAPPTGKFWRDWLFYYNDSANYSGNKKSNPLLKEKLMKCNTVWDATSAISHWVVDSLKFTSNDERPNQPVRIYRKHIGRCGEHQDMACAAGRAGLIPTVCTSNMAEDHVWNEFWDNRWVHWDANSYNNFDRKGSQDKDFYGGKDISTIWNNRGDGHIWSVTSDYTPTCTYTATVKDSANQLVDGAEVWIVTQNFYDETLLTVTTWGYTDYTGTATFDLGNARDYWCGIETDNLGEEPPDSSGDEQVTSIITNSGTGTYSNTFKLPKAAPQLQITTGTLPALPINEFKMEVSYNVDSNIVKGKNIFSGEYCDLWGTGGNIDFFIADLPNYTAYDSDLAFEGFEVYPKATGGEIDFVIPKDEQWYAVFSNEFSQMSMKTITITVNVYGKLITKIKTPLENSELDLDSEITITGTSFSPLPVKAVQVDFDNKNAWQAATDVSDIGGG